jgi:hypothetical protein
MDGRDVLEFLAGMVTAVLIVGLIFVFTSADKWVCGFSGEEARLSEMREKIQTEAEQAEKRLLAIEDEEESVTAKSDRLIEVCVNKVLHYRLNGSLTPRWNLNGTLISCDFGKYNISATPEPDLYN